MDMGKEGAVKCPFCRSDNISLVGSSDLFDEGHRSIWESSGLKHMREVSMHCEPCDHLFVFHVVQSGDMVIYGYHRMANCPAGCPQAAEHQA